MWGGALYTVDKQSSDKGGENVKVSTYMLNVARIVLF